MCILPIWALLQPCETYANLSACTPSPQQRGAPPVSRHAVSVAGTCASARGAGTSPSDNGAGPTAWGWRILLTAQTTAHAPSSHACPARQPSDLLMQQPCCKSWINLKVRCFSGIFLPCCGSAGWCPSDAPFTLTQHCSGSAGWCPSDAPSLSHSTAVVQQAGARQMHHSLSYSTAMVQQAGARQMHHSLSHSTASLLELLVQMSVDHSDVS